MPESTGQIASIMDRIFVPNHSQAITSYGQNEDHKKYQHTVMKLSVTVIK